MNELEQLAEVEQEKRTEVIRLISEGKTPGEIFSRTGVPNREQREIRDAWYRLLNDDRWAQQRSKQLTAEADNHFDSVIRGLYDVISSAEEQDDYKTKLSAQKEIANVLKMRVDFMQKAGIIGQQGIGDAIAEAEAMVSQVEGILKELVQAFPDTRKWVSQKLVELNTQTIPTRIVGEDG